MDRLMSVFKQLPVFLLFYLRKFLRFIFREFQPYRITWFDVSISLVVIIYAMLLVVVTNKELSNQNVSASWYQKSICAPSIGLSQNQGYLTPDNAQARLFLSGKIDSLELKDIKSAKYILPTRGEAFLHPGITKLIGFVWRVSGSVSWYLLPLIYGLFHGLACALLYFIFRMVSGRIPAVFFTFIYCGASYIIYSAARLFRDYSRVVFIFAVLWIILWLISRSLSWKKLVMAGLFAGLTAGIGAGFRQDFMMLFPFVFIGIFVRHGYGIKRKIMSLILLVAVFLPPFMLIKNYVCNHELPKHSGGANWYAHCFYIGTSEQFDNPLSIERDYVKWGGFYRDEYCLCWAESIYNLENKTLGDETKKRKLDFGKKILFRDIINTTPYDLMHRMLSSCMTLSNYTFGFALRSTRWMHLVHFEKVPWLGVHHDLVKWMTYSGLMPGLFFLILALLLIAFFSWKKCVFWSALYSTAAIQSLLFEERHFFYYIFLGGFLILFEMGVILRLVDVLIRFRLLALKELVRHLRGILLRLLIVILILIVLPLIVLTGTAYYQNHQVRRQMNALLSTGFPVKFDIEANSQEITVRVPELFVGSDVAQNSAKKETDNLKMASWVLFFDYSAPSDGMECKTLELNSCYSGTSKSTDWSRKYEFLLTQSGQYIILLHSISDPLTSSFEKIKIKSVPGLRLTKVEMVKDASTYGFSNITVMMPLVGRELLIEKNKSKK